MVGPESPVEKRPKIILTAIEEPKRFTSAEASAIARLVIDNVEMVVVGKHEQVV